MTFTFCVIDEELELLTGILSFTTLFYVIFRRKSFEWSESSIELRVTQVSDLQYEGYRMVFASTCEHASSAFIFASTSSDQICLASSEHFKTDTDGEQRALCKFSRRNLDFSLLKRNVLRPAIWLTPLNQ